MSWGDTWLLPDEWRLRADLHPVRRRGEERRLLARLREELDRLQTLLGVEATAKTDGGSTDLKFTFAKERVLDVLRKLNPKSFVFTLDADRLASEIEPPVLAEATHYTVVMEIHFGTDDEPGTLGIESNVWDNRRVWEVAHALFRAVGDALGAEPEEVNPAEAMGWDPSAILKPPKE